MYEVYFPWLPSPKSLHSFPSPSLHIRFFLFRPLWRCWFFSVSHQQISLLSPLSLHTLKIHFRDFFFSFSFCLCCLQCVRLAARSSWSRGWGRTGSSSFCWACSWLWSAGSWTTPSPSAKKVGKRQRARKRGKSYKDRWTVNNGLFSQRQQSCKSINPRGAVLYTEQLRGIVRYGVKVDGKY